MELSLPNFESLEKRIRQLSEEIVRIRERQKEGDLSNPIPDESRNKIEGKIRNLIELLEEF